MPKTEQSVLSLPARWRGHQPAGAGLNNLGNSCYLNSTLQCLAYVPPLGHLCLNSGHSVSCGNGAGGRPFASAASDGGGGGPCAFCLIERTLGSLLRGQRGAAVSPGEVVRHLHLFGRSFVRGRQEDSHEFLTALLDVMERDGRRAAVARGAPKGCRTIVEDLFVGCWQSQVRCLGCGHESNTYESFATLPLDIGQARTVSEGLHSFTGAERLDGSNKYRCDRCRQLVPAVKQTTIWDDPNVLVLHLKRFDMGSLLGKVSRHVAFPELLDLSAFMTPPAARQRAEAQHAAAVAQAAQQAQQAAQHDAASNGHHHHHHHDHHEKQPDHRDRHRDLDHHRDRDRDRVYGPQLPPSYNDQRPNGHGATHHHHHHHSSDALPPAATSPHAPAPAAAPASSPSSPSSPSVYALTGVLVHQGSSLHSGHYYALVRDSADRWSVMNDSSVYGTSLEQVRQEQAYLLFYTRQTMKLPRPVPVPPPAPAPPPSEAKMRGKVADAAEEPSPAAPAAGAQRRMIGPQLPPGIVRLKAAAAAAAAAPGAGAGAGAAGAGAGVGASAGSAADRLPPLRPAVARTGPTAPPSARLPAKPAASPAAAASRPQAIGPGPRPVAAAAAAAPDSEPTAPAAAAGSSPESVSRKRKHDEVAAAADVAAAAGGGGVSSGAPPLAAALEAEVAALQAGASWRDGVKRLKVSITEMVRESEWMGAARAAVEGLKARGLSLAEVLSPGGGALDEQRRLKRALPQAAVRLGTEELRRLLQSVLMGFGCWLSGMLPGASLGVGVLPLL